MSRMSELVCMLALVSFVGMILALTSSPTITKDDDATRAKRYRRIWLARTTMRTCASSLPAAGFNTD